MNAHTIFNLALLSVFCQLPLFADSGDLPPVREQGLLQMVSMLAIFLVFFYFILFRPEQRRRKAAEAQRNSLAKGDRVVAMGIVGEVFKIQDKTVILKMIDGSKIEVIKEIISDVQSAKGEGSRDLSKEDASAKSDK
jgi:preprotein translocase subunit YajC